jgi:hypothetical protein
VPLRELRTTLPSSDLPFLKTKPNGQFPEVGYQRGSNEDDHIHQADRLCFCPPLYHPEQNHQQEEEGRYPHFLSCSRYWVCFPRQNHRHGSYKQRGHSYGQRGVEVYFWRGKEDPHNEQRQAENKDQEHHGAPPYLSSYDFDIFSSSFYKK